jgi:ribonuclease J
MATLTFYGGAGEIGGNQILLTDGDTRVFLDFGVSFGRLNAFYDEFMRPRSGGGLRDLLMMSLVPKLDGIYRQDFLRLEGIEGALAKLGIEDRSYWVSELQSYEEVLKREGKPWLSGVLLTHAHLDHCQYISMLDPRIPIYCSKVTKAVLEAVTEMGREGFENELVRVKLRRVGYYGDGSYFPGTPRVESEVVERKFITFEPGERFRVGSLSVETFEVDHSVPGATAFLIETSDGKHVVYTGDLRFHGRRAEASQRFREALRGSKPDAMICDGSRIEERERDSEQKVEQECRELISRAKGLVIVGFAWKDLTRFETIRNAARANGRIFAISPKTAYLLNKLGRRGEVEDEFVRVYVRRVGTMLYAPGDYSYAKYTAGYSSDWEEGPDLTHLEQGVRAYQVKAEPSRYVVHLTYFEFNELLDLLPDEGALFISATSEPFDEEGKITEDKVRAWLKRFSINMPSFEPVYVHASGHVSGPELREFISEVGPRNLFPVHTERPELFKGLAERVYDRVELGRPYEF